MLTRMLICILMLMRMLSIMLVLVLFSSLLVCAKLNRLHLYAAAPICNFTSTFVPDLGRSLDCTYMLPHLSAISHPLLFPISPTYRTFPRLIVTH
jgi:hypothetical protein